MELTGERILLREFAESDVDGLLAVHSDPRVLRYSAPEVGTPAHARMLVEMFIRWANEHPHQNFQFAIVDLATTALLGVKTRLVRCYQANVAVYPNTGRQS